MRSSPLVMASLLFAALAYSGCADIFGSDPNIPKASQFDEILRRDLTAYVTDPKDVGISVNVELLRNRPTRSGVALPKFYVWLQKLDASGNVMEEAAARIAAVDGTHFDVVQYYQKDQILKDTDLIYEVFPKEVADKIMERARAN